jgi:uncharacterized protein with PIN domain
MPSVQRGGKLPVGYESLGKGKRKIGCFEKKHGIPPEAVRKSKKPKPARSDMYLGIKPSAPRCPTCASQVEFINLYYKNHPKEKNAGAQGGDIVNSKMFCPKCGGIPRRKAVRSDSVGRKGAPKKTAVKAKTGCKKPKVVICSGCGDWIDKVTKQRVDRGIPHYVSREIGIYCRKCTTLPKKRKMVSRRRQ